MSASGGTPYNRYSPLLPVVAKREVPHPSTRAPGIGTAGTLESVTTPTTRNVPSGTTTISRRLLRRVAAAPRVTTSALKTASPGCVDAVARPLAFTVRTDGFELLQ